MLPKDLSKLTVVQLKEELKSRNQTVTGKKAELVARLKECIEAALQEGQKDEADAVAETSAGALEVAPVAEPAAPPQEHAAVETGSAEAVPEDEQAASAAVAVADASLNVPKPVLETGTAGAEPDTVATTGQPEPAEPEVAKAQLQPAAPAGAGEEEIDYGGSEPEDAPAQAEAAEAQQEQPQNEAPPAVPTSVNSQSKMVGAAMGALAQGAPAPGDGGGRKRGAEDGAAHDERPGKVQRRVSGAEAVAAPGAGEGGAPPAQAPPTRALHIDGFVRPFTLNHARDLLGQWGALPSMWFPTIKNYCYAVYETRAQAEAARAALWQLQWPAGSPKRLQPRFVSLKEAEGAIGKGAGNPDFRVERTSEDGPDEEEEALEPAAAVEAEAGAAAAGGDAAAPGATVVASPGDHGRVVNGTAAAAGGVADLRELLSRRRHSIDQQQEQPRGGRQAALPSPAARARPAHGADAALSLDDLFCKTAAKPHLYWLPLTDEQVAEKRAAAAAGPAQDGKAAERIA